MVNNHALELFHKAAKSLPAYRAFLEAHEFDAEKVKSVEDFKTIPLSNKKNYLRKYPQEQLVWQDLTEEPILLCSTSGSTGEPYYFPRTDRLSEQYSFLIEDYLSRSSRKGSRTLVILGFGMGVWIGGIITVRAFEIAGARMKTSISILPTGYHKAEIFKALRKLAPDYDQTILVGYPPFIKELVDEAEVEKINLEQLNIRLLFAAEAFTEKFRQYVCEKARVTNPLLDTLNIYGTAEIGAMAYETPLSIMIRQLAAGKSELFDDIFGQIEKTPTLAQYNPEFMEFEEKDGEILLTGNNALPLIRYAVGDHGGVLSYQRMQNILEQNGIDINTEARKFGIDETIQYHPFVYVYERKDLSATLHGILIYPEYIKEALLDDRLNPFLSERFTMITKNDEKEDQYLEINLELQREVLESAELMTAAQSTIHEYMTKKSSEVAEISRTKDSKQLLKIVLWPKDQPPFFTPGIKQKWTMKSPQPHA